MVLNSANTACRLDKRDGFSLTSYLDVGLPVYRFPIVLTLQETSELGAIEEHVLRAIELGIDTITDLEAFLGLPGIVLTNQIGRLVYEHALTFQESNHATYKLLAEGNRRLATASTSTVARRRVSIYVDGITRKIIPVEPGDLLRGPELESQGYAVVYPPTRQRPNPTEFDLAEINKLIALSAVPTLPASGLRAVRVDGLVGKPSLYFQRALALAFKSKDARTVTIGFAIDGRQSIEHEIEYERSGAAKRSRLFASMFDASKRRREIVAANRELAHVVDVSDGRGPENRRLTLRHSSAKRKISGTNVRVLSVYDHPPLLQRALESATKRVMIVSPWLRAAVITPAFIRLLTNCLSRGVELTIAYGIGKKDPGEKDHDAKAREALEALAGSFSNFRLVRKGNTHAKVLLVDSDFFVTTSFNWLSFRGDPSQPMREEEGTMVQDREAVDDYYRDLIARLPSDSKPAREPQLAQD